MSFRSAIDHLQKTIESVLTQTYPHWELILVDNGSADGSADVARQYASERPEAIVYVDHEGHASLEDAASSNIGLERAEGKYVAFLDALDMWMPSTLARLVEMLEAQPDAGLVMGTAKDGVFHPAGSLSPVLFETWGTAPIGLSHVLFARTVLHETGGFEDRLRGGYERKALLVKACLAGGSFVSIDGQRSLERRAKAGSNTLGVWQDRAEHYRFLKWLEEHLDQRKVSQPGIEAALDRALERPAEALRDRVRNDGWIIRAAGGAQAEVSEAPGRPGGVRVEIRQSDLVNPWDVQLNFPQIQLQKDREYRVCFDARSDQPRRMCVGAAMAHAPWSGLGLYQQVDLTDQWQAVELRFNALGSDDDARLHFDLGGTDTAVELSPLKLCFGDGSPVTRGVDWGSFRRVTPVSRTWGFGRGKPVDRYYIEQFLGKWASRIQGRVLEIEDNSYTRQFGEQRVTQSDILHAIEGNPRATLVADLTNAPSIPDSTFDCIILTQTLQLIYDVKAAVQTLFRILKPGGVVLATFPGISQTTDLNWGGGWFWTFTAESGRRVFEEAFAPSDVEIEAFGNVLAATALLHGLAAEELSPEELDFRDRGYEVTIGVRAVKGAGKEFRPIGSRASEGAGQGQGLILMYHRVAEEGADPFELAVEPTRFASQLDMIRRQAQVMSLTEMENHVRSGRIPERSVALTFDDGYADNLYCAKPMLEDRHIPATALIATGYLGGKREFWWDELSRILLTPGDLPERLALDIGGERQEWSLADAARYTPKDFEQYRLWRTMQPPPTARHSVYLDLWNRMRPIEDTQRTGLLAQLRAWSGSTTHRESHRALDPDELCDLSKGGLIEVGAHTVTHPALSELPVGEQQFEIRESKQRIEGILGRPVSSFSYPFGAFTRETISLVAATGFDRACSTNPRTTVAGDDCLAMPRVQVQNWSSSEFEERLNMWFEHVLR